jgi:hypothetical protein
VKEVVGKGDDLFFIAKIGVKLVDSGILLFIAPSEFTVLQIDFLEVTIVKCSSDSNNLSTVCIGIVLVSSPMTNFVELASNEPTCLGGTLSCHQHHKECFF